MSLLHCNNKRATQIQREALHQEKLNHEQARKNCKVPVAVGQTLAHPDSPVVI